MTSACADPGGSSVFGPDDSSLDSGGSGAADGGSNQDAGVDTSENDSGDSSPGLVDADIDVADSDTDAEPLQDSEAAADANEDDVTPSDVHDGDDDSSTADTDAIDARTPCPFPLPDDERGLIPVDGETASWSQARCISDLHVLVAPSGSTWTVVVDGLTNDTLVQAITPHRLPPRREEGESVLATGSAADGSVTLTFEPMHSGEVAIVIEGSEDATEYTVAARCDEGCERETTRYPTALLHGYAGTDSYFGVLDYFFGIDRLLTDRGYEMLAPTTSPIASSEDRADQLASQLSDWMNETGARRTNLIAHSQGGLDARLLVSGKGWSDRVVSITTIATPHRGIPLLLADFLSVQDFSPDYMDVFNVAYPDVPGVRYWSWSARSCGILEPLCIARNNGEVVDVLLGASYTLLLRFGPNDGIVPTDSMLWGEHLGQLSADHFDEVGQIADLSLPGDPFRHRDFYLGEARRLAAAGL